MGRIIIKIVYISCWSLLINVAVINAQYVNYEWEQSYYANIDGEEKLVFTWQFKRSKIASGDLFGNQKKDLIIGIDNGSLSIFENTGSQSMPKFRLRELRIEGFGENNDNQLFRNYSDVIEDATSDSLLIYKELLASRPLDFGSNSAPALVDIFEEGLLDLVVGDESGRLTVLKNIGTKNLPQFLYDVNNTISIIPEATIKLLNLKNTVPSFCDINNDQIEDLLVGSFDGSVYIFIGSRESNRRLRFQGEPNFILSLDNDVDAAPSCIYLEDDDTPSIIVGKQNGQFSYFKNIGTSFSPEFSGVEDFFLNLDVGGYSAPHDLKFSSNSSDLLIGSINSNIEHFEIREVNDQKIIWSINENLTDYQRLNGLGFNTKFTAGDIFGNNRQDLIIGNKQGMIALYENISDGENIILEKKSDNLFPLLNLPYAAPEIIPSFNDNPAALLIGIDGGIVHYFNDLGTTGNPNFQLFKPRVITSDTIIKPIVRLLNYSSDENYSVIVGGSGGLSIYKNYGDYNDPQFDFDDIELVDLGDRTNLFNAPSIFNWNKFLTPNIVIGNDKGDLEVFNINPETVPILDDLPIGFQKQLAKPFKFPRWNFQEEMPEINPFFMDIYNDGSEALIVSNLNGDLLLFTQVNAEEIDYRGDYQKYLTDLRNNRLDFIRQNFRNFIPKNINPDFIYENDNIITNYGTRPVPTIGPLKGSFRNDLVVGYSSGEIKIFENVSVGEEVEFEYHSSIWLPDRNRNAAPLMVDLNNDMRLDLVVGSANGQLYFYKNTADVPQFKFQFEPNYFRNINTGYNSIPSRVYVRGQKYPDLLIGERNGKSSYIKNRSEIVDNVFIPRFFVESKNFFDFNIDSAIAPRFDDINNDNIPELIIGTDQGKVRVYQYLMDNKTWRYVKEWSIEESVGFGVVPSFGEINGMGVKDMILGVDSGSIYFYKNNALDNELIQEVEQSQLSLQ